jgi:hypothetical protein
MDKIKSKDYITLSPKYGVNPSTLHCYVCYKEIGIILFGKLKGDAKAPKDFKSIDFICDDCKKRIEEGQ